MNDHQNESTISEIRPLLNMIGQDLELLARLHGHELNLETVQLLKKAAFPQSLAIDVSEVTSELNNGPLGPIMTSALDEVISGGVSEDELAADFAAIYLNGSFEASPNESAWLDEDHLERQEPMFEIRNWYKKYGLETGNWQVRPDDNLSLQLLFLGHLLQKDKLPIADLGHFMDFHLLRWVEDFAKIIFQRADTAFYASLAPITALYLNELRDIFAEIENKPRRSKTEIEAATKKVKEDIHFDPVYYSSNEGGW